MQRVLADLFVVVCCVVLALCFCRFSFVVCGCFLLLFLVHRSSSLLSLFCIVLLVVSVRTKKCYSVLLCDFESARDFPPRSALSEHRFVAISLHFVAVCSSSEHT